MNIPGINTLRTLEERKNHLIKKFQCDIDKNRYLTREINALDEAMNLIQWIINNSLNDIVQKTIEKYKQENSTNIIGDITTEEEKEEIKDDEIIYGILHENSGKNHKLEIVLSKSDGVNYVTLESNRRKNDKISWKKMGKVKITVHRLERILKRIKAADNPITR